MTRALTPDLMRGLAARQEIMAAAKLVERRRPTAKGCLCQDYCWWRLGLGPGHLGADIVQEWGGDRSLSSFHPRSDPDCSSLA